MRPDKQREIDKALRMDAKQQMGEAPRYPKTGDKSDGIKHRLDECESLLMRMSHCVAGLLSSVNEFKDDEFVRKHWFVKWHVSNVKKLIAKAESIITRRLAEAAERGEE